MSLSSTNPHRKPLQSQKKNLAQKNFSMKTSNCCCNRSLVSLIHPKNLQFRRQKPSIDRNHWNFLEKLDEEANKLNDFSYSPPHPLQCSIAPPLMSLSLDMSLYGIVVPIVVKEEFLCTLRLHSVQSHVWITIAEHVR